MKRAHLAIGIVGIAITLAAEIWTSQHIKRVAVTKHDVVRWCMNSRNEDADTVRFYCEYLSGDEYIKQGVKPSYDKYPEIRYEP